MSWPMKKIEDIFDVARGGSPRPIDEFLTDQADGINWIMIGDTKGGGKYIEKTAKKIKPEGGSKSRFVKEGDFLLTNSMSFGRPYILKTNGCIHDGWLVLSPLSDQINTDYFYYYLGSDEMKMRLSAKAAGAVVKNLNKDIVKSLKIPLPPLATQKKIAAILDAADAHRHKTKQLLARYDELAQSIFLEMFGDPVTNPKGWDKVKLGSVTDMKAGKFVSASEIQSEDDGDSYQCFGGNGLRGYVKSYTHEGDFILIGRQGALCGNVKLARGIFHATEHAIVCSPKFDYETFWLFFLLDLLNLNKYATGAAQPGLNVGKLIEIEIIFPQLELQAEFVEKLKLLDAQKEQILKTLDQSENLFNSLLQKAFKGELVK